MKKKKKYVPQDKERYEATDPHILQLKENILLHNKDIWIPSLKIKYEPIDFPKWFSFQKHQDCTQLFQQSKSFEQNFEEYYYKTIKAELIFNDKQKYIIDRWLNSSTQMYNATVDYIKTKNKLIRAHQNIFNEAIYNIVTCNTIIDIIKQNYDMFNKFYTEIYRKYKKNEISRTIREYGSLLDKISQNNNDFKRHVNEIKRSFDKLLKQFKENYDVICSNFNVTNMNSINIDYFSVELFNIYITNYDKTHLYPIMKNVEQINDNTNTLRSSCLDLFLNLINVMSQIKIYCISKNISLFKEVQLDPKMIGRIFNYSRIKLEVKADFIKIRALLKKTKKGFINKCIPEENPYNLTSKNTIHSNMMDGTIDICCSNFRSMMTNYMRGHINSFRLRKIKEGKNNKILKLEQYLFRKGTIARLDLGQVKLKCLGNLCKEFDIGVEHKFSNNGIIKCGCKKDAIISNLKFLEENETDCMLHYNKSKNQYILLISKKIYPQKIENRKKILSIDPGLRTLLTCLSENEVLKICERKENNKNNKVLKKVLELRNLKKIKNKSHQLYKTNRKETKIKNLVSEMHWKVINYLTKNYDTILMGNMSTKSIISNKSNTFISDIDKDYLQRLSLFKFRTRLGEKCATRKVNYLVVDEFITSKMCSVCGKINWDLKGEKIYKCINESCKQELDRDGNGCRNIFIKSLI